MKKPDRTEATNYKQGAGEAEYTDIEQPTNNDNYCASAPDHRLKQSEINNYYNYY